MSRTTVMIDEETARWADRLADALNATRPPHTEPSTRSSVIRTAIRLGLHEIGTDYAVPNPFVGGGK